MSTAVVAAPPAAPLPTTTTTHHHRLLHILAQNDTVSLPRLKQIHAQILRTTQTNNPENIFLYSKLLHHTSSQQDLNYAFKIFAQIQNPNSFIYNTLIRACARSRTQKDRAFSIFQQMLLSENVLPDKHTFPFLLKACAYLFALREGEQAHGYLLKNGFGSDVYIGNSLIHFYGSCGCSESARKVFDEMSERTAVSWNSIIDALVSMGEFEEALRMFVEMKRWFEPDGYTMQSVIDGCAGLGALSLGMWAHAYILKRCEIGDNFDVLVKNSLVEMYCKCGSLSMARQVFQTMRKRDVNSWNVMILGLAMHGEAGEVFEHFHRMVDQEKLSPNSITFVGVLSACNHRGLVDKGLKYFELMIKEYKIEPVLQHYGCIIDLLAKNGQIDKALDIVSGMKIKPDAVIWRSLLDASCKQGASMESTQEIANKIIASEDSGSYVLLSKVYAFANRWNEVGSIRKLMTDKGVSKEPGCSSIEIDGVAHEFFAGDTIHPQKNEIYRFLDLIDKKLELEGYVPDYSQASMVDEIDEGKGNSLRLHSERLAIAFGLLNLKPGVPIRVFKNLRVCNDCHSVTKLISRIYGVEIIMRDRIRFHHFRDGKCSCMDYW